MISKEVYNKISEESWEKIIERKKCERSGNDFPVFENDVEQLKNYAVSIWEEKFTFPMFERNFEYRQMNRMMFRNEKKLYKWKCSATGKPIISIYGPSYTGNVVTQEHRRSDDWDPLDHWIDFDFSKSFNEQFEQVYLNTPKMCTTIQESENCKFTNSTWDSKDCYMSFRCHYNEEVYYSYRPNRSKQCIDCFQVKECDRLYECVECYKCQNGWYLQNCTNCFNSNFLINCVWCHDCFLCANMTNASYCIWNKQYTKEEYEKIVSKFTSPSHTLLDTLLEQFRWLYTKAVFPAADLIQSELSTGSSLVECNRCFMTFMMKSCEDCRRARDNVWYKRSMDNYSGWWSELCYNTSAAKLCYNTHCSLRMRECNDCTYCMFCFYSKNCFGCVWLRNKEFCIFNKQYTRDEYNELVPRIIRKMEETGEWWKFFDSSISAFPYNDTWANEAFPITVDWTQYWKVEYTGEWLSVDAALDFGTKKIATSRRTKEEEVDIPSSADTIPSDQLPWSISDVTDDILKKIIICSESQRPYRILPTELRLYRDMWIPLPRYHMDIRHAKRIENRPNRYFSIRSCDKTWEEMLSVYPGNFGAKVYNSEDFNQLMFR